MRLIMTIGTKRNAVFDMVITRNNMMHLNSVESATYAAPAAAVNQEFLGFSLFKSHESSPSSSVIEQGIIWTTSVQIITVIAVLFKSKNHAEDSEIHRAFRLFRGFAWYTLIQPLRISLIGLIPAFFLLSLNRENSSIDLVLLGFQSRYARKFSCRYIPLELGRAGLFPGSFSWQPVEWGFW